jgi:hypothetical protein
VGGSIPPPSTKEGVDAMSRSKRKKKYFFGGGYEDHCKGYHSLEKTLIGHAPAGYKCFINSEWSEDETSRMALCCGYDDFKVIKGHYDLVEGEPVFDGSVGCMLFVPEDMLKESLLDYA